MDYTLSPSTEADAGFLAELFNDVRGPEFQLAGLPPAMLEQLLTMQRRAQAISYAAQFPNAVEEIVWIGGERAGRVLVDTGATATCLVDIALLGRFRGQGVGTRIVEQLCAAARSSGRRLHLSVRSGNPAARLYERLGFVALGGGDGVHIAMELGASPNAGGADALEEDEVSGAVPQDYTRAYFRTLVGQRLAARTLEQPRRAASVPVELMVEAVERLVPPQGPVAVDPGDSFVVQLHGNANAEELLPPENIEVRPAEGEPMVVFLTPLGPRDGRMRYEIVFNRAQPKV